MVFLKKSDWYEFSEAGVLNTSPRHSWDDFKKLPVKIRKSVKFGCRWLTPGMQWFSDFGINVQKILQDKIDRGETTPESFVLDHYIGGNQIINGEVIYSDSVGGFHCWGSTIPDLPMRPALAQGGRSISRPELMIILGEYYEQLMDVVDSFPDHVVEFTFFKKFVGRFKERLVVWEIRKY